MKRLHRQDLFAWSEFDEERNIDFNSVLWVRDGGNVVIDPLPMSPHDQAHLMSLGGVATIVISNSEHERESRAMAAATGARILGPKAECDQFLCDGYLDDGDEIVPGLTVMSLEGSKTPGELAFVLDGSTLITGDLVRAHEAGRLCLLPDQKLTDKKKAVASLRRLAALPGIEAVLIGDGWPIFRHGAQALDELAANFV